MFGHVTAHIPTIFLVTNEIISAVEKADRQFFRI